LGLRAVVFDFGMVLTGLPNQDAHAAMVRITQLSEARFEQLYWLNRHAYDEGKLTGIAFWQEFLRNAGLPENQKMVEDLNEWDACMWTTQDPAMLGWHDQLKQRGLRTAILSNMGDNVLEKMKREFDWLSRFDVLVWSFQLRMAKPDPAIYHYTLNKLGAKPEETLFIDDKQVNVDAARSLGIHALQFTGIDRLRADLVTAGFSGSLPLPA
jgi:putative hydrolase of the HAD superfamily